MPGFDGTGPLGQGSMTGRGLGFCVLTTSEENPGQVKGLAGLQSVPVGQIKGNFKNTGKEMTNMPFGDGTGPAGMGPMTGRAAGFCAGYPVPGYMNPVGGRGYRGRGRGAGWGRGFGRGFGWARAGLDYPAWDAAGYPYAPYPAPFAQAPTPEQELAELKQQAEYFQNALDEINKRTEQLEAESKK